jgi:Tol biopolymer transport system component
MNATDGSEQNRLTDDDRNDLLPSWSPDGTQIAFASDRDSDINIIEIFVMNATDGSDVTRLTDNDAIDANPSWSPDGTQIAFASDREDGNFEIFVMNATDGSEQTNLSNNGDARSPDWGTNTSPAGSIDNG